MMKNYNKFYKYIDLKILAMLEVVQLHQQEQHLLSDYWRMKVKLENKKKALKSQILRDKNERAKWKKKFDIEQSLEVLKRSVEK